MEKKYTCPCCGTVIMVNKEALAATGNNVVCPQCQAFLHAEGDYLYVPVKDAAPAPTPSPAPPTPAPQASEEQTGIETPPPFHGDVEDAELIDDDLNADKTNLYKAAVEYIKTCNAISVPMLQRYFDITEQEATFLMDDLERDGIVGPEKGGPRKILIPHHEGLPGMVSGQRTYETDQMMKQMQEKMQQQGGPKIRSCSCSLPMILLILLMAVLIYKMLQ